MGEDDLVEELAVREVIGAFLAVYGQIGTRDCMHRLRKGDARYLREQLCLAREIAGNKSCQIDIEQRIVQIEDNRFQNNQLLISVPFRIRSVLEYKR